MANDTAVAFCFVGQFIRHATLTRDVRRFGALAHYHAFVASSLQHEEERPGDVVDSATLCSQLRAVGFSGCDALLEPYNASAYYRLTKHLGLRAFYDRDGRRLVLHLLEREDVAGEDVAELRHGEVEMDWCAASSVVRRRARLEFAELL